MRALCTAAKSTLGSFQSTPVPRHAQHSCIHPRSTVLSLTRHPARVQPPAVGTAKPWPAGPGCQRAGAQHRRAGCQHKPQTWQLQHQLSSTRAIWTLQLCEWTTLETCTPRRKCGWHAATSIAQGSVRGCHCGGNNSNTDTLAVSLLWLARLGFY